MPDEGGAIPEREDPHENRKAILPEPAGGHPRDQSDPPRLAQLLQGRPRRENLSPPGPVCDEPVANLREAET